MKSEQASCRQGSWPRWAVQQRRGGGLKLARQGHRRDQPKPTHRSDMTTVPGGVVALDSTWWPWKCSLRPASAETTPALSSDPAAVSAGDRHQSRGPRGSSARLGAQTGTKAGDRGWERLPHTGDRAHVWERRPTPRPPDSHQVESRATRSSPGPPAPGIDLGRGSTPEPGIDLGRGSTPGPRPSGIEDGSGYRTPGIDLGHLVGHHGPPGRVQGLHAGLIGLGHRDRLQGRSARRVGHPWPWSSPSSPVAE